MQARILRHPVGERAKVIEVTRETPPPNSGVWVIEYILPGNSVILPETAHFEGEFNLELRLYEKDIEYLKELRKAPDIIYAYARLDKEVFTPDCYPVEHCLYDSASGRIIEETDLAGKDLTFAQPPPVNSGLWACYWSEIKDIDDSKLIPHTLGAWYPIKEEDIPKDRNIEIYDADKKKREFKYIGAHPTVMGFINLFADAAFSAKGIANKDRERARHFHSSLTYCKHNITTIEFHEDGIEIETKKIKKGYEEWIKKEVSGANDLAEYLLNTYRGKLPGYGLRVTEQGEQGCLFPNKGPENHFAVPGKTVSAIARMRYELTPTQISNAKESERITAKGINKFELQARGKLIATYELPEDIDLNSPDILEVVSRAFMGKPEVKGFYWKLWKFASERKSASFSKIKLRGLLKELAGNRTSEPTAKELEKASEILKELHRIEIAVTYKNGRKYEEYRTRLIDVYYRSYPEYRRGPNKGKQNESRFLEVSFRLFPSIRNNHGIFKEYAQYLPNGFAELDSRKDATAINIADKIQAELTRINWNIKDPKKLKPARFSRKIFVELAGLEKTDQTPGKRKKTNRSLNGALDKLVEVGTVRDYTPKHFDAEDDTSYTIYPNESIILDLNKEQKEQLEA